MHLEREGVFPWGPGDVSLPYLVSEDTEQVLLFAGKCIIMECVIMCRVYNFLSTMFIFMLCVFMLYVGLCTYTGVHI